MTPTQKYYTLLGLVCEDFPHYAVEMAVAAGCPGERQRLHDVKRGRTVSLPDLLELVRYSLPRFEVPTHLLPDEEAANAGIEEFVKNMFLLFRVARLEVSAKWLAKSLSEHGKQGLDERAVRHYLQHTLGLEPSSVPKRLRIPLEADYTQLDVQGHPEVTAYHVEMARSYTLLVQNWLTQQELRLFASPIPTPELTTQLLPEVAA